MAAAATATVKAERTFRFIHLTEDEKDAVRAEMQAEYARYGRECMGDFE